MIVEALALLLSSPAPAIELPRVVEVRYRPRRARKARHRKAASDLDACCWPASPVPKVKFLSVEEFYDLFPAFKKEKP